MIWVKKGLKRGQRGRSPGVDIFNLIIQKVQDTGMHLEVDEEQWIVLPHVQF